MEDIFKAMVKDEVTEKKIIKKKIYQSKKLQEMSVLKRKWRMQEIWSLRGTRRSIQLIGENFELEVSDLQH